MVFGRFQHSACGFKQQYFFVFAGYSFDKTVQQIPIEMLDTKNDI
jgi:hypothetical protein